MGFSREREREKEIWGFSEKRGFSCLSGVFRGKGVFLVFCGFGYFFGLCLSKTRGSGGENRDGKRYDLEGFYRFGDMRK